MTWAFNIHPQYYRPPMPLGPESPIRNLPVVWPLTANYQRSESLRCEKPGSKPFQFALSCAEDHWDHIHKVVRANHENMRLCKKEHIEHEYSIATLGFIFTVVVFVDSRRWLTAHPFGSFIACFCTASPDDATAQFIPHGLAGIINALWFASLILTAASCLMCYLSLQWLQEFKNEPQFATKNQVAFRQIRYDTLCRLGFFGVCDVIPLMMPLASAIWFTGLIVLLWELKYQRGAYVFIPAFGLLIIFTALHPLWCLFVVRQNGLSSGLSPFRSRRFILSTSKSTWHNALRARHPRGMLPLSPSGPTHTTCIAPQHVVQSIDWLEEDCSNLLHPANAKAIDTILAGTLIWIDSNPTIEKTSNLVSSMYCCINDLCLPTVFMHFNSTCTRMAGGLGEIFHFVARERLLDEQQARVLVLKLWLESHVNRIPELKPHLAELHVRCMYYFGKTMGPTHLEFNSFGHLQFERLYPLEVVVQMLVTARDALADNTYFRGTFNVTRYALVRYEGSGGGCQIRDLVFSIFGACEEYVSHLRASGDDKQQIKQFRTELEEFLGFIRGIQSGGDKRNSSFPRTSSEIGGSWADILSSAKNVHSIVESSFPHPVSQAYGPCPSPRFMELSGDDDMDGATLV